MAKVGRLRGWDAEGFIREPRESWSAVSAVVSLRETTVLTLRVTGRGAGLQPARSSGRLKTCPTHQILTRSVRTTLVPVRAPGERPSVRRSTLRPGHVPAGIGDRSPQPPAPRSGPLPTSHGTGTSPRHRAEIGW